MSTDRANDELQLIFAVWNWHVPFQTVKQGLDEVWNVYNVVLIKPVWWVKCAKTGSVSRTGTFSRTLYQQHRDDTLTYDCA